MFSSDMYRVFGGRLLLLYLAIMLLIVLFIFSVTRAPRRIANDSVRLQNLINDPNFTRGTTFKRRATSSEAMSPAFRLYELQVLGTYIENGQAVQIDETFVVTQTTIFSLFIYDFIYIRTD